MDLKSTFKVFCALAALSVAGFAVADDAAGDNEMTDVVQTDDGNGDLTNQSIKGCDEEQQDACPCSESANEDKDPASSDPGAECVKFNIAMGRTRYSALTKSIMLQLNELTPNSALYSPSGFKVVAGFAVNSVSRVKNASGAPKYVTLTSTTGVPVTFEFADGESVGAPLMTTDNLADGRLAMVDAQGWATASDPAYYDYYPGEGARWRFGAAALSPDYMQFVEHQTPEGRVETRQDLGLEIIRDEEGGLRQVVTPAWVADFLVTGQDAYDLKVYPNDVSCIPGTRTAEGFLVIAQDAAPDVVWEFRNPEPGVMRDLQVTKKRGTVSEAWLYKYVEDMRDFTLVYPNSVKQIRLERYSADDKKSMLVRRSVLGADGKAVSVREKLFDTSGKVGRVVKSVRDPGGLDLTRTYSYIQEGACVGLRKETVEENGSWTRYEYDDQRRVTAKIRPWLDAPTNAPVNQCDVTRYSYVFVDPADFLHGNDNRSRTEIEEICGIEVARTYYAYPANALGQVQEIEERAAFQGAPYGHASNRRTVKTYYAPSAAAHLAGRLASITYPGSKVEEYGYEYGTFNAATFAFAVDADGGAWRETVTTSYGANSGVQTLRSARVWDEKGREVLNESYVEDGAAFALIGWKRMSYDLNGKLVETDYSDGRVESATWGANCCGKESETSADGIITVYGYNALKQKVSETKKGFAADGSDDIIALHTYDLDGRLICTIVTNYASRLGYVGVSNLYDSAGRVTNSIDRLGNGTVTAYASLATTVRLPNGMTRLTERYLDGRVKRVLENGVVTESYAYGINVAGTRWTLAAEGLLPAALQSSLELPSFSTLAFLDFPWSLSTRDMLRQTISSEKPGFGGTTLVTSNSHDNAGNLIATSEYSVESANPVSPLIISKRLYSYAADGLQEFSVLDLNTNGVIDLTGPDRVTGSISTYEKDASNNWWRVDCSWVYPEFDSSAAVTTAVQRVLLSGLGVPASSFSSLSCCSWLKDSDLVTSLSHSEDIRGNVSTSATLVDRDARKVTRVAFSPASVQPTIDASVNGLPISKVSSTAVTTTYAYDLLGRQTGVTDGRGNTAITAYNALGQVAFTEDAAANRTVYAYDFLGRRISVTDPLANATHTAYDADGRVLATWGSTYPAAYEYDASGRMIAMATTRDPGFDFSTVTNSLFLPNSSLDVTRWLYDGATGLLTNKVYADGLGPIYTYTPDGKLASRLWARGVLTVYAYDAAGSLVSVAYSDDTPGTTYAFDRRGNTVSITDASGIRAFANTPDGLPLSDALAFGGSVFTLAEKYDIFGRNEGYALSNLTAGAEAPLSETVKTYDTTGRLERVDVGGAGAFAYTRLPGSDLVASLAMPNGVTRETVYDPLRNLPFSVTHTNAAGAVLVRRTFSYDAAGRLSGRTQYRLGDEINRVDAFGYNVRSELTSAALGTNVYAYAFDPIGNRISATENTETAEYLANALNQYTNIQSAASAQSAVTFIPDFDADGNQTLLKSTTGIWHVTYNADNRPVLFSNENSVVEMAYDHMGRRFEYKETVNNTIARCERYLYRGYLQLAALDLLDATNVIRMIVWDPKEPVDTRPLALLSGTNQWCYGFDQTKNVTEMFDASGALAAAYDYAPFGAVTEASGPAAALTPLTFSSEIADASLGLVYHNYRYLNALDGRWTSRDPIAQQGDRNRYSFVHNDPTRQADRLGLMSADEFKEFLTKVMGPCMSMLGDTLTGKTVTAVLKCALGSLNPYAAKDCLGKALGKGSSNFALCCFEKAIDSGKVPGEFSGKDKCDVSFCACQLGGNSGYACHCAYANCLGRLDPNGGDLN